MRASRAKIAERRKEIGGHVESAMISHSHRGGEFNKLLGATDVDSSVQIKDAQDNAICAELLSHENIALHDLKFIPGVAEISAARSNHDVKNDGSRLAHGGNQPCARRHTSIEKATAQFDAVCSATLGSHGGLNRIDAHFENEVVVHGWTRFAYP